MKRTGELLKQAREQRGVTINEVALVTKINAKTIELMETGRLDLLPQKAFLRGFVQTYARYLGLDQKELLAIFQEETGSIRPVLPQGGSRPERISDSPSSLRGIDQVDPANRTRMFLFVGAGLTLVIAIFIVFEIVKKYENESKLPPTTTLIAPDSTSEASGDLQASPQDAEALPLESASSDGSPTTSTTTLLKSAAVVATTSTTVITTTTTTTRPTTTTSRSTTTTRTTTTSSSTTSRTSTTTSTTTSRTTTTLAKAKAMEVILESLGNVSVDYRIDGGESQSSKLTQDQIKVIRANSQVELNISDGGAVNIIRNGVDQGVPGTLGKPIKLKLP